jgi:hypothetical protein
VATSLRPSVLYVLGQDRSGSTILGDVLAAGHGWVHIGEMRHLWSAGLLRGGLCGCGTPVRSCEFWSAVLAQAFPGGAPDPATVLGWQRAALRIRHLPGLLNGSALRSGPAAAYARVYGRLYEAVAAVAGASVIVDSSKSPMHGALVAHLPSVDVAFLHLVRDPRATAHSWMRGKPAPGQNPRGEMWRMPAWRAARAWLMGNAIADRVRRRRPSLMIRYEDVMADPRRSLEAITSLVGPPALAGTLTDGRWVELPGSHSASGNPIRLRTGRVELREDDAWRTDQRPLDRFTVTVMTLPLLHRFGYPVAVGRGGREGARA